MTCKNIGWSLNLNHCFWVVKMWQKKIICLFWSHVVIYSGIVIRTKKEQDLLCIIAPCFSVHQYYINCTHLTRPFFFLQNWVKLFKGNLYILDAVFDLFLICFSLHFKWSCNVAFLNVQIFYAAPHLIGNKTACMILI